MKVLSSYPEITDILDEYLINDDNENEVIVPEIVKKSLKRKRGEQEIFDEIMNAYGHVLEPLRHHELRFRGRNL